MSPGRVSNITFDEFYNIIDGKQKGASKNYNGVNPATKEKLWDVPVATKDDVNTAVEAGQKAFKTWSKTPIEKRKQMMKDWVKVYEQHEKEFADTLCKETGKPRSFATSEVAMVKGMILHHSDLDIPEEKFEDDEKIVTTRYQPLGVVGAISPWNFPLLLAVGKIAQALLAGCVVISKPSPFTPYTVLKLVETAQEIFPPGVVQVLGGGDDLGPALVEHPGVAKISFTGSIATGKKIMESCAKTLKRVTLELGGNDPCIIFPDVDIEKTVPEVAVGSFWNSGQVCVATKRVYIHESIYREFVDKLVAFTKNNLKVGTSDEENVMLGPIQNEMQFNKVKEFFADSKKNGYKFALGDAEVAASKGFFIQPTIIDNPPNDSLIIREEPFGPILPVQPWSDLEEVIARANNTDTGLGASVWTKDVKKGEEVAQRIESGNVFVNSWVKPVPQAFFSGHKTSGLGGEWGNTGVLAYCNAQAVHVYK
ncbi:aldehyde dehydrogenase [Microthyrium microscopicum]|uniref:aldehyde dehydrogenase (NAD(+)) n=1 Tax=Microthyrium microscopicum TaxID=703497 RepID=A0A6A6UC57_9PEZI|nr:aldehyde dehydrogenase [Microthyrium microscopicum]